ncbi:MAG: alcohol dehydrogenase, partial [Anaerotignaceae bacterium]
HPNEPVPVNLGSIHSTQKRITGAQNGSAKTFWQAIQLLNKSLIDVSPLIEKIYTDKEFEEAIACAMRSDTFKVILEITD